MASEFCPELARRKTVSDSDYLSRAWEISRSMSHYFPFFRDEKVYRYFFDASKKSIVNAYRGSEVVIIDIPSNYSESTIFTLSLCDYCVIPAFPSEGFVEEVPSIFQAIERARSLQGAPVEFLGFVAQRVSRRFKKDGLEKGHDEDFDELENEEIMLAMFGGGPGTKHKIPDVNEFANAMVGVEFRGIMAKIDAAISRCLNEGLSERSIQKEGLSGLNFQHLLGFTENFHSLDLSDQDVSDIANGIDVRPRGKGKGNKASEAHITREAERKRKVLDYEWLAILSEISNVAGRGMPRLVSKSRLEAAFQAAYSVVDKRKKSSTKSHDTKGASGWPKSNRSGKGAVYANPLNPRSNISLAKGGRGQHGLRSCLIRALILDQSRLRRDSVVA